MADNTTLNSMSGGDVIATDDITGVKYQKVKIGYGADGSWNEVTSTSTNPLPVQTAAPATGAAELAKAVDAASGGSDVGIASLFVRDDTLTTLTPVDGDYVQGRVNANGALWIKPDGDITIADGGNTITVDGTVTANLSATDNAVLDAIQTAVETIDNAISGSEMQVDIVASIPAGTNNIGDVDVASIAAGANVIGDVGISGARTSGGTTIFRSIDLDESEEEVKATAGQLYWLHVMNLASSARYLKIYNATAATVVVGTTTPVLTFPIPTQGDTNGAGFTLAIPNGIAFSTAITVAATTGIADSDTGAPGANEVVINLGYA